MELKILTHQQELELAADVISYLEKRAGEGLLIRKEVIKLVEISLQAESYGSFIYPASEEKQ